MSIELITILLFGSMIVLLALGLPVAFALGGVGVVFTVLLWGVGGLITVPLKTLSLMQSVVLTAIPFFVFMGFILERSGIADNLFEMMNKWVGGMRGGLGIATVAVCTAFAAMTGISGAATVTMSIIALPAMLKRGYSKTIAIGSILAGGALGVLVPPSVLMIIYAWLSGASIGRLFAAGVFPGLLMALIFMSYIGIRAALQPGIAPAVPVEERVNFKLKLSSLKATLPPIILVLAVLGTMFAGIATPTEAAAFGAFGAVIIGVVQRKIHWPELRDASKQTLRTTGLLMWIVLGASFFVTVYIAVGAKDLVLNLVANLPVSPWVVLLLMQVTLLIMGFFLETTGIAMITIPVFVPIIQALGFDPIWFGILFIINMEMGFLTPPFGINLFYMKGVVPKDVTLGDIYRSVTPFVILQLVGLIIVMAFPQIALWLPNLIFGPPL